MSISRKITEGGSGGGSGETYVDDVFSTYVYTGNFNNPNTITNGIDLAGKGGLVWVKSRNNAYNHGLIDTVRGRASELSSNTNGAANTVTSASKGITSFNSDGFTLGTDQFTLMNAGGSTYTYTSWTWRIKPKFFDVVTYTGDGVAGRDIPHNLGSAPGMMIIKRLDETRNWVVYHQGIGNDYSLVLQRDIQAYTSALFNYTTPTANSFTIHSDLDVNADGGEYVAYLFAHDDSDEGMIQCGSYTGNGSGDGPEITLGWEPQWLLVKDVTNPNNWFIWDVARGLPASVSNSSHSLYPNLPNAESVEYGTAPTPLGFKITDNNNAINQSGSTYIYMAIRRPNKPAEEFEPEELFAINTQADNEPAFVSGFPVDFSMNKRTTAGATVVGSRLIQEKQLYTSSTAPEDPSSTHKYDYMDGWSSAAGENLTSHSWMWRRAPGFMDVVCYEGDGQAGREIPHNLGAVPEMMWVKCRSKSDTDTAYGWWVYSSVINRTLLLNQDNAGSSGNNVVWNDAVPDINNLTVGSYKGTNHGLELYIAYLFASVPGISKVGSYTGNGLDQEIDCGFTNGARFVLVKRTDAAGDWLVQDSLRGLTGEINKAISLNSSGAQVSGEYTRTYPAGFIAMNNSAADNVNASGGEYIYMAIA